MTSPASSLPVIACVPQAIPLDERASHFELGRQLLNSRARSRESLPGGYKFIFEAELLVDIARFVANERRCCPFMTFEIQVSGGDGSLRLRMTGPIGTREVLDAELGIGSTCGCK